MQQAFTYIPFMFSGFGDHEDYVEIGSTSEWQRLIDAWDMFQRYRFLQNDEGLSALSDILRGARREKFFVAELPIDPEKDIVENAVFAHPSALSELILGCCELRDLMNADAVGQLRRHAPSPLVGYDVEKQIRLFIRDLLAIDDKRVADLPTHVLRQRACAHCGTKSPSVS